MPRGRLVLTISLALHLTIFLPPSLSNLIHSYYLIRRIFSTSYFPFVTASLIHQLHIQHRRLSNQCFRGSRYNLDSFNSPFFIFTSKPGRQFPPTQPCKSLRLFFSGPSSASRFSRACTMPPSRPRPGSGLSTGSGRRRRRSRSCPAQRHMVPAPWPAASPSSSCASTPVLAR